MSIRHLADILKIACISSHLLLFNSVFGFNNKVFFNQAKPFTELTLFYATFIHWWDTYHKSYIHEIRCHLLWVQSKISIMYRS